MTTDAFDTILVAAQAGAEWAVAELYRTHNPRLVSYLRVREPQDHADIASETWLDVARNLTSFHGSANAFDRWIFTVARHRLVDHWRAKARRPVDPTPDTELQGAPVPSAEMAALDGRLADEAAQRILDLLPADQAEVVLLRVVAGLDVDDVAAITGKRPGTVRVAQHRALKRLAKELGPSGNAGEEGSGGTPRDAQAPSTP
jgi:RNA polymerase sigma-70 factor (ECF subfamily)